MRGGLADDPSAFIGAARNALDLMKAKQSGLKKRTEYPDREEVTFFAGYSAPEPREGPCEFQSTNRFASVTSTLDWTYQRRRSCQIPPSASYIPDQCELMVIIVSP